MTYYFYSEPCCCLCPPTCSEVADHHDPEHGVPPRLTYLYPLYRFNNNLIRYETLTNKKRPVGLPPNWPWPVPPRPDPLCALTPSVDPSGLLGHRYILDDLAYGLTRYNLATHSIAPDSQMGVPPQYYEWDGVTTSPIWFPITYTPAQASDHRRGWYEFVFPNYLTGNLVMRGLRQLYDHYMPFLDDQNPTVAEYEVWCNVVFNHFRFLVGLCPIVLNHDLFIRVALSNERNYTTVWDTSYPGVLQSAYGPCVGGSGNVHCGSTFIPSVQDQEPYFNCDVHPLDVSSATETMLTSYYGNAFVKMSRNLAMNFYAARDGVQLSGHAASWAFRTEWGFSLTRTKWAGTVCQPPPGFTY